MTAEVIRKGKDWGVIAKVKGFDGPIGDKCKGQCGSSDAGRFTREVMAPSGMEQTPENVKKISEQAKKKIKDKLSSHLSHAHPRR